MRSSQTTPIASGVRAACSENNSAIVIWYEISAEGTADIRALHQKQTQCSPRQESLLLPCASPETCVITLSSLSKYDSAVLSDCCCVRSTENRRGNPRPCYQDK